MTKARSKKYKKARYAIRNISMKDLSNKIKEFENIVEVPYLKRTPKHEPTSSYFHLILCLEECMMRFNHQVHDGYEKEMAPSSDVNDTDRDMDGYESNNSIVHDPFDEPSSENLIMDVSESECNILNETLLQSDFIKHYYGIEL